MVIADYITVQESVNSEVSEVRAERASTAEASHKCQEAVRKIKPIFKGETTFKVLIRRKKIIFAQANNLHQTPSAKASVTTNPVETVLLGDNAEK